MARWFNIDERIRFVIIGLINTIIRYLIFVIIGVVIGITHYQITLLLSWLLSSLTAFLGYKILVFRSSGSHIKEYIKSLIIWTISYLINASLLGFLVEQFSINAYIGQAIVILLITIINYLLFKHFAFRKPHNNWPEKLYNLWE